MQQYVTNRHYLDGLIIHDSSCTDQLRIPRFSAPKERNGAFASCSMVVMLSVSILFFYGVKANIVTTSYKKFSTLIEIVFCLSID